jgi:hypothetical protein
MKHRLIRFIKKGSVEQHTQTDESRRHCDVHEKSDNDTRSDLDSMSRVPCRQLQCLMRSLGIVKDGIATILKMTVRQNGTLKEKGTLPDT